MALPPEARLFAMVPAAGTGERMGAALPKQYLSLRGKTLAEHTLSRLLSLGRIEQVVVAVAQADPWWPALSPARDPRVRTVTGGASRAESVLLGLEALAGEAAEQDWVLVHDMARPCVRLSDIEKLINETRASGGILALPSTDTIKLGGDREIVETLDRDRIWRALTPQLFPVGMLRSALRAALDAGEAITDEASAVEKRGHRPVLVAGRADNIKVTLPDDLPLADFYLQRQEAEALNLWAEADDDHE